MPNNMDKIRTHNQPEQTQQRKKLRQNATPEERVLWKVLRGRQLLGYKWRRQFSEGPYILDFYCPELKLCVEVDGLQHTAEEEVKRDNRRTAYLSKEGITVLRVSNEVVWKQSDLVASAILDYLQTLNSSPRVGEVPEGRRGPLK